MKRILAALLAVSLLVLSACAAQPEPPTEPDIPAQTEPELSGQPEPPAEPEPPEESETPETPEEPEEPEETEEPEEPEQPEEPEEPDEPAEPEEPDEPLTKEAISALLAAAIAAQTEEIEFSVAGLSWEFGAENDLKNLYYGVLAADPALKYAYDMQPAVTGDTAVCRFSYMPYKTGAYDAGLPAGSHTVGSLRDAKVQAQSMVGGPERLSIAITDPALSVNDLQRALMQAGNGYLSYQLSRDATEIIASAPVGMTLSECAAAIAETYRLAGEIMAQTVTDDMTQAEKMQALYDYIVGSVAYDFRYYNDRDNMPYESTVALGALRDGTAICGGYAQAFQTMLDLLGVESYTVSGTCRGEYHMWNYVVLDGQGYYCDPTADRGGMRNHYLLTEDELTAQGGYTWDAAFLHRLAGTN